MSATELMLRTPVGSLGKTARAHCADVGNLQILREDARVTEFETSNLLVSYYCMQFIPPRDRQKLFDKICAALNWSGALVLFEKACAPDARFQDIVSTLYNGFKLANGFTGEKIGSKTRSLKGIFEPLSAQGDIDLEKRADIEDITNVQKCLCVKGFSGD